MRKLKQILKKLGKSIATTEIAHSGKDIHYRQYNKYTSFWATPLMGI